MFIHYYIHIELVVVISGSDKSACRNKNPVHKCIASVSRKSAFPSRWMVLTKREQLAGYTISRITNSLPVSLLRGWNILKPFAKVVYILCMICILHHIWSVCYMCLYIDIVCEKLTRNQQLYVNLVPICFSFSISKIQKLVYQERDSDFFQTMNLLVLEHCILLIKLIAQFI